MRSFALAAGVVIALFLVAACSTMPVLPGPGASQSLTILGSPEEEYVRGMVRAFEKETGIKTNYIRRSSGEALEMIRMGGAPSFSVWWGGPIDGYIQAVSEGLLEPYQPRSFGIIPRKYKDPDGQWTGVYVGVLAIAVNDRVLRQKGLPEPIGWADLAKLVYRGHVALAHPSTSGTAYTMLSTVLQLYGKDLDRGFNYFRAVDQNVWAYERSGSAPVRIVGQGEAAIGVGFSHDIVATIESGYEDLRIIYPAEGTGYEVGGMALLRGAPNPEAGKRFMDWALGAKAQEMGPDFGAYQIPTNPDARVHPKSARLQEVNTLDYDFEWAGQNRFELIRRFNTTVEPPPPLIDR
jgi:iron(III) transport system substrate-binding protein